MSEPEASPPPARPSWFRFGAADLFFLVLVLGIIQNSRTGMVDDPGLGWHIRNIDAMREQGGWLTHDPFTLGKSEQRWFANQWLGDVVYWLANEWAGLNGIAAVTTLVLALTFRLLYGMLVRDGVPWSVALVWAFLAALGTSSVWVARPNVFTILFAMITARVCDLVHRGETRTYQPWLLLPLFAIWANTHGGFLAGFIILVASGGIELAIGLLADDPQERPRARQRARLLGLVTAGAFVCTLLNPYGFQLYSWVFQLVGDPYFMSLHVEWLSPDFHDKGAFRYELLILLLPVILAYSEKKPSFLLLSLAVLWLHFALDGRRYVPLFVVIVTPLLARHSIEIAWLRERVGRWLPERLRKRLGGAPAGVPFLWTGVLAVAVLLWARWGGEYARHNPSFTPSHALDQVLVRYQGQVIFHDYGWGGYLTWHGWDKQPRLLNWIDDRNEVQGRDHVQEYFAVIRGEPGWQQKLNDAKVDFVIVKPGESLAKHMLQDPAWNLVFQDAHSVLFERVR
jgi:hypothetical protein